MKRRVLVLLSLLSFGLASSDMVLDAEAAPSAGDLPAVEGPFPVVAAAAPFVAVETPVVTAMATPRRCTPTRRALAPKPGVTVIETDQPVALALLEPEPVFVVPPSWAVSFQPQVADLPPGPAIPFSPGRPGGFLPPPQAVPEPSTWALLIVGFGSVGFMLRRKGLLRPAR